MKLATALRSSLETVVSGQRGSLAGANCNISAAVRNPAATSLGNA